ncbi:7062_t:CDS:2 [Funneliformis geosporum]|nr:7062_t:CDS:2 [Funneliformis geosporum]
MANENIIPKTETVYELKEEYKIPSFEEFLKSYEYDSNLNYTDLNGGDIGETKGYGPCSWNNPNCTCYKSELQKQYIVAIRDNNSTEVSIPLPIIRNVSFSTTGSSKYDNYRVVGTVFGGLIGNLIGGAIEDRSMRIPSGTDRVDFHDYKISCSSRDHLVELRDKIGKHDEGEDINVLISGSALVYQHHSALKTREQELKALAEQNQRQYDLQQEHLVSIGDLVNNAEVNGFFTDLLRNNAEKFAKNKNLDISPLPLKFEGFYSDRVYEKLRVMGRC